MATLKHTGVFKLAALIFAVLMAHSGAFSESAPICYTVPTDKTYSSVTLTDSASIAVEALQIECPENISTYTDINECTADISNSLNVTVTAGKLASLTWEMTGATKDNSPRAGINQIDSYVFNEGTTTITYTAKDRHKNNYTCVCTVVISDNQVPKLVSAPENITVTADEGECGALVSWTEPEVVDNCTPSFQILKTSSHVSGSFFPLGNTKVNYIIDDGMATTQLGYSFTVTVTDKMAPVMLAPKNITANCGEVLPRIYSNFNEFVAAGGTATDNCTVKSSSFTFVSQTQDRQTCPYTITRTYQISDVYNNVGKVEQLIFVTKEPVVPATKPVADHAPVTGVTLKSGMADITLINSGNWDNPANWSSGTVPNLTDNVNIPNTLSVTINTAAECKNITIASGGTVNYSGANTLKVYGDWTNNGTYDGGTNGIVEFTGTANAIINGTTNFQELIISKGGLLTTLNINGTATVLSSGTFTLTSGLVKIPIGGSFAINPASTLNIPALAGIHVDGGTLTTGDFTITNEGLIEISSGTANLGTNSGNSVLTQNNGAFIVTNGTVNIAGRLENSAAGTLIPPGVVAGISIAGGIVTLATVDNGLSSVGTLNVTSAGTFNFTGGTIVFQKESTTATPLDLVILSGTGTKTTIGGTFQFGNVSTPANSVFNVSSEIPLNKITSFPNADFKLIENVIVGQMILDPASTIDLNGKFLRLSVSATGTYTFPIDNGSGISIPVTIDITGGTFAPGAYIEIETYGSDHLNNASSANYLNRYWRVTTSGITNPVYDVTATYADTDIAGNENSIAIGSWGGSLPWVKGNAANAAANTISATGITSTGFEFTGITLAPPSVTISATSTVICVGASTTITANPVGDPGFTYSWTSNPVGFTGSTQNITVTPATTTIYTVIVTDGNGFVSLPANITVTVNPLPTASISGTSAVCQNAAQPQVTFTGTSGTSPYIFTYDINGAGTFTATSVGNTALVNVPTGTGGNFTYNLLSVQDNNGCQQNQTGSATITVNSLPSPTAGSNSPECEGQTINLTATGGTSYSWTGPDGFTSTQQNPSIANVTAAADGTYTVTVTDANGCSATASTTVTIYPKPTVTITANPGSTICSGTSVTFTTLVNNAGATPTFKWQINGVNVPGETGSSFTTNGLTNGQIVRVIMTADPTHCSSVITSNSYTMTVNPTVVPSVSVLESNSNICAGTLASFTAVPLNGGTAPGYQWQNNGVDISGATSSVYSSSALINGDQIRVVLTSNATCASPATATSAVKTMTVNPVVTPSVSISADPATPVCPGTTVTFTAAPTNGGTNPTYQWKVNGVNVGTNLPTFTSASLVNSDIVSVVMTSNATCVSPATATSNDITMVVNPGTPSVPGPISGNTMACPNVSANYSVAAVPNATSYLWSVPMGWTITAGNNTASITVTTGATGQNGDITVTASNSCGTSPVRTLAVTVGSISTAPTGITVTNNNTCFGTNKTLTVTGGSLGTGAVWEWFTGSCGGTAVGTGSSITVNPASGTTTTYYVRAAGTCNTTACASGNVIVNPATPSQPAAITGTTPVCPGITTLVYSIAAVTNASSYTWAVPTGWTITAGQGTTSITVTSGTAGQNGNITVTATNSCGTSTPGTLAVVVSPGKPNPPGVITGLTNQCFNNTGLVYSVAAVPNATTYTWTVPGGWTITDGNGTNSIIVSTTAGAVSGNITVTSGNSCGTSTASTLAVIVSTAVPTTPATPTGNVSVCTTATLLNYSVTAVANATNYLWALPTGWTIVTGAGTRTISVNPGTPLPGNYNVSVRASNACGSSAPSSNLGVSVGSYATADAGPDRIVCNNVTTVSLVGIAGMAADPSRGSWTSSGTSGTISPVGSPNATYTPSASDKAAGTITLSFTTDNPAGPCNSVTDQFILTIRPLPNATISGATTICAGTSATITFTGTPNTTVTYSVTGVAGTSTINIGAGGTATLNTGNLSANTTYSLVSTDFTTAPSCPRAISGSVLVTVNSAVVLVAGGPDVVCQSAAPSAITLAGASRGGSASTAAWSITSGGGTLSNTAQTANPATVTYTPAVNFSGSVVLTLTSNDPLGPCGPVSVTRTITVNPVATVVAGGPDLVCQSVIPTPITLSGASLGGSTATGAWSIVSGGGTLSSTAQTATPAVVTYTPAANYTGNVIGTGCRYR